MGWVGDDGLQRDEDGGLSDASAETAKYWVGLVGGCMANGGGGGAVVVIVNGVGGKDGGDSGNQRGEERVKEGSRKG